MQIDESATLARAQQGDPEAFSYLVEVYQKPVYNLCYRMLSNAEDAEDAAQEVFLRAYKSIKQYDRNRPFPTWLLSIAAHYCIDQIRKQRLPVFSLDDQPYYDLCDQTPGPERSMSQMEDRKQIRLLLESVAPLDRAAVVMYYWYDFSYEEIAQSLSLTESAVKSRLHRARKEMARLWLEQNPQAIPVERKPHESPAF